MAAQWFLNGFTEYKEYLQAPLTTTLTNGGCYLVRYFVRNPAGGLKYVCNNFGAFLSNFQFTTSWSAPGYIPQITAFGNPIVKDTARWTEIGGVYTAIGGENTITIGNFYSDANTDTLATNYGNYPGAYYHIDDVALFSINPFGVLPWAYRDTTVNLGDSVYIGNNLNGFASSWYTLPGAFINNGPGIFVSPTITTNYVVQFTICGVPRADTLKVTVNPAGTGINEFNLKSSEFVIRPNPSSGLMTIEILKKEFPLQNSSVKIYDMFNREIKSFKLTSKDLTIDFQDINSGIYYLKLLQEDKLFLTKKIIKQ